MACLALMLVAYSSWTDTKIEASADVFNIGYFELPPHIERVESGELEGPALEYVKLVLDEMNISKYSMKGFPVQRAFQMLLTGEVDVILFAAKTPNTIREDFILTDVDVSFSQPGLIVKKNSSFTDPLKLNQLAGKELAFWSGGFVPDFLKNDAIKLINVTGENIYKRGFMLVKHERVDAFFHVDSMALEWWLEHTNSHNELKLLSLPYKVTVKSIFSKSSSLRYKSQYEAAMLKVQETMSYRDFFFRFLKNKNGYDTDL
jgi:ABC-type amino acid transport substrate-binding protein